MICKNVLFGMLLTSIVVTNCCQDGVNQKIKQLKETRLQKVHELSNLGKKITKKDQLIDAMTSSLNSVVESYCKKFSVEKKEEFMQAFGAWSGDFINKLEIAIHKNMKIKGFLCKECIDNMEESIGTFKIRDLKVLKFIMVRCYSEMVLRNMLLERYEDILQQIIELDNELFIATNRSAFPK
jgi:hypothetical protein